MGMMTEADVDVRDAEELARLVRFMTRPGRRFGLALATYNDAIVANEARELASARADVHTTTVTVAPGEHLVERLVEAGDGCDVVFVIGLDEIAYDASERGPITQAVVELNMRRDELPDRLDVRVVFWISTEAYGQLARLAWDLLDVMLLRFEFLAERAVEPEQAQPPPRTRPAWMVPVDDANVAGLGNQAASFADVARTTLDEFTKVDAAASAGQLFASIGRLDDAAKWLEFAALGYERLGQRQNDARYTLAAATQLRRAAQVAQLRGDAELARRLAERSSKLAGMLRGKSEDAERESMASLSVLASTLPGLAVANDVDEQTLLDRWRDGDADAGAQLMMRYMGEVRDYFAARVPADVVEDLVQETFLRLTSTKERIGSSVKVYILHVAINVWRERVRQTLRTSEVGVSDVHLNDAAGDDDVFAAVAYREESQMLLEALQRISLADAELLELAYWEGLSSAVLGQLYDIPEATVRSRLRHARLRLAKEWQQIAGDRPAQIMDEVGLSRELEQLGAKLRRAV